MKMGAVAFEARTKARSGLNLKRLAKEANWGAVGFGTVFNLYVGLGLSVKTNPTAGNVRKTVKILGTSLTGARSVTFTGATTAKAQVVTPAGTLSSNAPFTVKP